MEKSKAPGQRLSCAFLRRALSGHGPAFCQAALTDGQEAPNGGCAAPSAPDCVDGVRVAILVNHRVAWGERVAVVGQDAALGAWQLAQGLALTWGEGDVWRAEARLAPGAHEFKCVTIKSDGQLEWEVGANRVIQVPPHAAGLVEARCRWADTANTTVAVPGAMNAASKGGHGSSSNSSMASEVSEAFRSCSSDSDAGAVAGSIRSHQLAVPLMLSSDDGGCSTAPSSLRTSACGAGGNGNGNGAASSAQPTAAALAASAVRQLGLDEQQQQQRQPPSQGGSISLTSAGSSGDVSMYTVFDGSSSGGGGSGGAQAPAHAAAQLPPMPPPALQQQLQQQQAGSSRALTAASLKEAAAADARARGGAAGGRPALPRPMSVSSSPYSAAIGATPASTLLSPLGTDASGQLPAHCTSSSTLSFSSIEASEAVMDDSSDEPGGLTDEGVGSMAASDAGEQQAAAGASLAAAAAAAARAAGDEQQQLFENARVYEQLMAVEPELLLLERQQQQLIQQQADAALQAVRRSSNGGGPPQPAQQQQPSLAAGPFGARAAAAPDADEDADVDAQELLDAVAELCALPGGVDAAALLPSEDTLPPTALSKFAALAEIQEAADDEEAALMEQQLQQEGSGGGILLPNYSSTSEVVQASPPGGREFMYPDVDYSSGSSTSSRLSKDQLPMLGLTVNAPSAAAMAAAQMSAANEAAAAAAAAAAKVRPSFSGGDPLEVPVASEGLRLLASAHSIPHVDKAHTGGEDAFFISTAGHGALGVSDGVSAWAEDGIDPGEYSRTLAQYCAEAFEERVLASAAAAGGKGSFVSKFDPRALLRYAQQCTCKPGSATMVLAALQPGGSLHVANLGDCGIKVVRGGRMVYETKPQQHDFNLPYQLSHPQLFPDTDTADSADRYTWQVQEGDVVVAASDGLFDNLWDDELLALLQQGLLGIVAPMDSAGSMSRTDSLSSIGSMRGGMKIGLRGRHSRSSSTSQLPTLVSGPSTALPVFAAAAAAAEDAGGEADRPGGMPRSRSTSHLSSWGAKQLRKWKSGGKVAPPPPSAFAAAAAAGADDGAEQGQGGGAAAGQASPPPRPLTPSEVGLDAVSRAAELLAAAAAAHAADKEFRSPWSVAAGRAYGLLARLFAKGGKMDDITCVVAVVQEAGRVAAAQAAPAAAAAAGAAAAASSDGGKQQPAAPQAAKAGSSSGGGSVAAGGAGSSSSDMTASDAGSVGAPCLTSEGSGLSAAVIEELQ